jgi:hypothetical protein
MASRALYGSDVWGSLTADDDYGSSLPVLQDRIHNRGALRTVRVTDT